MTLRFIRNPYAFVLSSCAFGLAIGFAKFYNRSVILLPQYSLPATVVYFPFFPNILDSMVMLLIAAYLGWISLKEINLNNEG